MLKSTSFLRDSSHKCDIYKYTCLITPSVHVTAEKKNDSQNYLCPVMPRLLVVADINIKHKGICVLQCHVFLRNC